MKIYLIKFFFYICKKLYYIISKEVYVHVRDIDLMIGGIGEKNVNGGAVGPTFACIIGK